jgi:dTDP-4-dehydrorhamnose 3,5-epimerase-like enzyme
VAKFRSGADKEMEMIAAPRLIQGRSVVDDRGAVGFVNDFNFEGVRRFYTVTNHARGFVRAWHGHRHEAKYVTVLSGSALVCCIRVDDWERPSPELEIHRHVLSDQSPAVLFVPPGFVNGFMTLTEGARVTFFSTSTLDESLKDDVRFPARYWDPWSVVER